MAKTKKTTKKGKMSRRAILEEMAKKYDEMMTDATEKYLAKMKKIEKDFVVYLEKTGDENPEEMLEKELKEL